MSKSVSNAVLFRELKEIRKEMSDAYVSKLEFKPVAMIAYGMVGLIVTAVFTALVAQVVKADTIISLFQ